MVKKNTRYIWIRKSARKSKQKFEETLDFVTIIMMMVETIDNIVLFDDSNNDWRVELFGQNTHRHKPIRTLKHNKK